MLDRGVPELIEAVQKGTMAASKAAEIASFDPARQRRVVVGIEPLARARAACAPNDISCEDQMPRMTEEEFEFASVHSFLEPCPMLSPHQAARAVPTGRRDGVIDMAQRRRKWLGEFLSALGAPDGG